MDHATEKGDSMKKKLTSRKRSVAIDTVPLPEKVLGTTIRKGKLSKTRNKYVLTVGRKKVEVPVGIFITKSEAGKLVGKEVRVAYSKTKPSSIVAIGTWPTPEKPRIRPRWILCYIPAPDILRRVDPVIRTALINKLVNEGIIMPSLRTLLNRAQR